MTWWQWVYLSLCAIAVCYVTAAAAVKYRELRWRRYLDRRIADRFRGDADNVPPG